jgi:hypothetical protein
MATRAILTREKQFGGMNDNVTVIIRGERVDADKSNDLAIDLGPVTGAWWDVPLPPCPDCGGGLIIWHEAGYVPGTRQCVECQSLFHVRTVTEPEPEVGIPLFSYECDNGHRWVRTEQDDIAADHKCPACGGYWQ